jgi:2-haloacid dehalogenase
MKQREPYAWYLFDADNTLFDYDAAEIFSFKKTIESGRFEYQHEYLDLYRSINDELWGALEKGEITSEVLRVKRFELLREILHLDFSPAAFSKIYLDYLSENAELIDGALDILCTLHQHARIAIVTNGLKDVQRSRISRSPVRQYMDELVISEEVGAAKPSKAFFDRAFAQIGFPDKRSVLLVGDSITSDIQGGINYGLDTCWYNPKKKPRPEHLPIKYEITSLQELRDIG